MAKRIITALVALGLFLPVLIFSGHEIGRYVFIAVIGVLSLVSMYEICDCFGLFKKFFISIPMLLFSVASTVITIFFSDSEKYAEYLMFSAFAFIFIVFSVAMFHNGSIKYSQAASLAATALYIVYGFISIVNLRYAEYGAYIFLLVFIGAWATDTGAYFTGVLFGKHKLIPEVSPKKTVEGAVGGVIGCIAGYLIFGLCMQQFYSFNANYTALACVAVLISVVSQFGDLIASYIKRENGIKDYGFIFPGHGGVMDRFDSIIAVAPVLFCIVVIFGVKLIS